MSGGGRAQRGAARRGKKSSSGIFVVEGITAVSEYLKHRPESVLEITAKTRFHETLRNLLEDCGCHLKVGEPGNNSAVAPVSARVRLQTVQFEEIKRSLDGYSNVGEDVRVPMESSVSDQFDPSSVAGITTMMALDHVTDPRNLGAIVRSAAFFGVRYILVPTDRQVLLTSASVATSQGGFAKVDLISITNLRRALEDLKYCGVRVYGADQNGQPFSMVEFDPEPTILVVGSESKGLSPTIKSSCQQTISIPGAAAGLESLNVSVAAGILLQVLTSRN